MSVDPKHIEWLRERVAGLVVAIQAENAVMGEFQFVMDAAAITSELEARQARVWIDSRRIRDGLLAERDAILAVLAELKYAHSYPMEGK